MKKASTGASRIKTIMKSGMQMLASRYLGIFRKIDRSSPGGDRWLLNFFMPYLQANSILYLHGTGSESETTFGWRSSAFHQTWLLKEALIYSEFACCTWRCRHFQSHMWLKMKKNKNRIFIFRALIIHGWNYSELP
jgi:hypothetical protein